MVTFGPTFFSGVGCIVCAGVAKGGGVSVGLGDGGSASVTVADGERVGVADAFLRLDFSFGVAPEDGVGEAFFLLGDAVGDALVAGFSVGCFRCFRVGVGVGVGSKIFLIFVPNDSSAAPGAAIAPKKIAQLTRPQNVVLIAGNNQLASS
jgi:hypothetical protein